MRSKLSSWAQQVAEIWRTECPEIVDVILGDEDYVFPFLPPADKRMWGSMGISAGRAQEIEQITIDLHNKTYTSAVREALRGR